MSRLSPPLRLLALALLCSAPLIALADPPKNLDARVAQVMREQGVPGMAVAIVENGHVVHAKGYGVRRLGSAEPVDADTIFPIGSTSKAMTVAALATLVDEKKIGWDDRVIDHLPGFQMYDAWVTRELTIRDLLVHRSGLGLGAGDLMFVPRSSLSRAESVRRLRYIKPATSFRSGYAYDNVLYMVAGSVIEAVSGQTWEAYIRDHVFKPAGMRVTTSDENDQFATANRAQPHARMDGGLRGVGRQEVLDERASLGRNAAPAGGVASSANDMARWLEIQLAHGVLPEGQGKRLYSEVAAREMWTPQINMPISQYPAPIAEATPQFSSYALGWDVEDYRGAKIISHGGAVLGAQTMVVLIPDRNIGFSLNINSEDGVVLRGLMFELLDHYLGQPERDWVGDFSTFRKARVAMAQDLLKTQAKPVASRPTLPLAGYAGRYSDPWYGPISLRVDGKRLRLNFEQTPNMQGTLEHWQYDTFIVRWDDRTSEPAYMTFRLDEQGKVDDIRMKAVSPIADFSWDYHDLHFTPQAEAAAGGQP